MDVYENHMLAPRDYDEHDCGGSHECAVCGDSFYAGEVTAFANGDEVCEDCLQQYTLDNGSGFFQDFAMQHIDEAAEIWFFGRSPAENGCPWLKREERKGLLRGMFWLAANTGLYETGAFIVDFCRNHDEFPQYAGNRINEGERTWR